jgi:hypothetical protein
MLFPKPCLARRGFPRNGTGGRKGGRESRRPDLAIPLGLPLGGRGGRGVERCRGAEVASQAGQALAPRGGVHGSPAEDESPAPLALNGEKWLSRRRGRFSGGLLWIRLRRWNF